MIQIDFKNSTIENFSEVEGLIPDYLEKIKKRDQGFYQVIDDENVIKGIEEYVKKIEGTYEDIVVLGIGGSALGTICLQQSLKHLYENNLKIRTHPKLHVLDNIDPLWLKQIDDIINYSKTLFIVVSKSGGTPETLSQYFYFRKRVEDSDLEIKNHFLFITGAEGLLREISNEEEIKAFEVPKNVGGRFSVLTPVGLLPSALIGINIRELINGAKEIRDSFLSKKINDNYPFQIAALQYLLGEKGKSINIIMPYSQRLIRFADWYRQLLAESIGKEGNGLTPVKALGVTDQHSQSQLYNEGPNDKFFIFIKVENFGIDLKIPEIYPDKKGIDYLHKLTFNKLIHTELEGTIGSLAENKRPNITITIDKVNEENLGRLFMLFEGATAFLGEFYGINAFNQPGVELSKNITKKLLANN